MLTHLQHHFHFPHALNRELTELYASISIRSFAIGLVSIFEPIYIFLFFNFSIPKTLLFFAVIRGLFGILSPFGAKIITRIGVKHSFLLTAPILFFYYLALWHIQAGFWVVISAIILAVIYSIIFWPAFHIDFCRFTPREKRGFEVSKRNVAISLSAAIAPFIGGVILIKYGFPILFLMVLILLFVSVLPLFLSQEIHETYADSFERAFGELRQKKYRNAVLAFSANGIERAVSFLIWPLFLFISAIDYSSIGQITSGALILGMIASLYIGRLTDRTNRQKLLRIGSMLMGITWLIKMVIRTPLDAFLAHTLYRFAMPAAYIPYLSSFYDMAARKDVNRDRIIILREISANLAMCVLLLILAFILSFVNTLIWIFPIAALASLGFVFIAKSEE